MTQTKKTASKGGTTRKTNKTSSTKSSYKRSSGTKKTPAKRTGAAKSKALTTQDYIVYQDIKAILIVALSVLLFACNFGLIGTFGTYVSDFMFGLFGVLAYVAPLFIGFILIYKMFNLNNPLGPVKIISGCLLFLLVDMIIDFSTGISRSVSKFSIKDFYSFCAKEHKGGGIFAEMADYGLNKAIGVVGTYIVISILILIFILVLTGKSLIKGVSDTSDALIDKVNRERDYQDELQSRREAVYDERRRQRELERTLREEELLKRREEKLHEVQEKNAQRAQKKQMMSDVENAIGEREANKVLKANSKVKGITLDTTITPPVTDKLSKNDEIHEITLNDFDPANPENSYSLDIPGTNLTEVYIEDEDENEENMVADGPVISDNVKPKANIKATETHASLPQSKPANKPLAYDEVKAAAGQSMAQKHEYVFPPISLLSVNTNKSKGDSAQEIRNTAQKLQETLATFGVEATVTDISQGPTVTRFELQPKLGVKVSRIKNLSDDIKLNLAAADIRIEAPIPGKAAIGIEVPNKENQAVLLRDLIDTPEFKKSDSNLAFAVGKDIAGKTIIYDIDKFPHLLIAGATGSGKSVCINTLIMSIIYKAHPNDVKLIMIDPKVVELSVYNGIPHLLCPVVTDAKKASATLNFAVNEMMERYQKFAAMNTRDLAGYNRVVEENGEDEFNKKLPQIVIIVDELADLIMVAKNEVEDAICRLAQLARAAGIHLIIATQRPSVDVITGLIKANMPSRLAFAVSSAIDSRTILDMGGAEELLGKGDMLFFPKGLKKPVRLQGGFVSDQEVNSVVDFLKQQGHTSYDETISEKIEKMGSGPSQNGSSDTEGAGVDDEFINVGRFVIESNKASIGWVQRRFKMGFNRAARIMDQLADAGVVGPDEGTKARQILMSSEQFENYIENEL